MLKKKTKQNSSVVTSLVLFFKLFFNIWNGKKCGSQIYGYKKKKKKKVNGTLSRHLALVTGQPPPPLPPVRCCSGGGGGGGTSCIAALAHLTLHHHLPSNTAHAGHRHRTWDPRPGGQAVWVNINFEDNSYRKVSGRSLLLGQWAHPRLLPEEETGPPVTWILLRQPCRHITTWWCLCLLIILNFLEL